MATLFSLAKLFILVANVVNEFDLGKICETMIGFELGDDIKKANLKSF